MLIYKSRNVTKLPDSYAKKSGSNNDKILSLNERLLNDLKKDMTDVYEILDIFKATGKTLDLYGETYGVKRGTLSDSQYRYIILSTVNRCMGNVDYDSIINFVTAIFNCDYADILMEDMTGSKSDCIVKLIKTPYSVLAAAGFTTKRAKEIIESLFPICVRLEADNFEGTFEFGDESMEHDELKGFGNVEQTIGGFFGLIYGDDLKFKGGLINGV